MKALVQRVNFSELRIDGEIFSKIGKGFLVLLGVEKGDTEKELEYIENKVANLRVFEDPDGKMNLALADIGGEMMIVSQFTLCADCSRGNRPSFINAEEPEKANAMYEKFIKNIQDRGINVATGKFGTDMKIKFENDGPVTIMIESLK